MCTVLKQPYLVVVRTLVFRAGATLNAMHRLAHLTNKKCFGSSQIHYLPNSWRHNPRMPENNCHLSLVRRGVSLCMAVEYQPPLLPARDTSRTLGTAVFNAIMFMSSSEESASSANFADAQSNYDDQNLHSLLLCANCSK